MRFKKIFLLFICLSFFYLKSYSQHNIRIIYPYAADSSLIFTYYFNNSLFALDTLKINHLGECNIRGNKKLQEGIYSLVLNQKRFDFLIGKKQSLTIHISPGMLFPIISGNKESEAFMNYQSFLIKKQKSRVSLINLLRKNSLSADSIFQLKQKLKLQDREMLRFWEKNIQLFKGTMTSVFFQSLIVPEQPEFSVPENIPHRDSILWVKRYNYQQQHFVDNFPLNDSRVLRTPVFYSKIKNFIENQTLQIPDSVMATTIRISNYCNGIVKKTLLNDILELTFNSQIMGMDAVFVAIAEKYYLQNSFSVDTIALKKIKEQVELLKPNLIGNIAPNLKLPSLEEGHDYQLSEVNAPYTVLVFWEPECGFCKTEIPRLHQEIYIPFKNEGIQVFAVNIATDRHSWDNFINQNNLSDWINVYDPNRTSGYWKLYNITSTPVIYVLDRNKHIIAKRIDIKTLKNLLTQWLHS